MTKPKFKMYVKTYSRCNCFFNTIYKRSKVCAKCQLKKGGWDK